MNTMATVELSRLSKNLKTLPHVDIGHHPLPECAPALFKFGQYDGTYE